MPRKSSVRIVNKNTHWKHWQHKRWMLVRRNHKQDWKPVELQLWDTQKRKTLPASCLLCYLFLFCLFPHFPSVVGILSFPFSLPRETCIQLSATRGSCSVRAISHKHAHCSHSPLSFPCEHILSLMANLAVSRFRNQEMAFALAHKKNPSWFTHFGCVLNSPHQFPSMNAMTSSFTVPVSERTALVDRHLSLNRNEFEALGVQCIATIPQVVVEHAIVSIRNVSSLISVGTHDDFHQKGQLWKNSCNSQLTMCARHFITVEFLPRC